MRRVTNRSFSNIKLAVSSTRAVRFTVARAVNPRQYVGTDWNASLSKVIDNALVGVFVVARRFFDSKRYVG